MRRVTNFIKTKFARRKAFSLIELSIVMLIVGVVLGGVTQSSSLIRKYQLSSARHATENSPINSMTGLVLWLETTAVKSFDENIDLEDGEQISNWYDLNPTSSTKYNMTASGTERPTYTESCINNLPCLTFDGVDDYISSEFSMGLTSFTIITVMEYTFADNPDGSYLLSSITADPSGDGWLFMSTRDTEGDMENGVNYPGEAIIQSVSELAGISKPYMVIFSEKTGVTITNRTNKTDQTSDASTSGGVKNIGGISVGGYDHSTNFKGKVGEVIMFDRALKIEERNAIEEYLIKKWNIKTG